MPGVLPSEHALEKHQTLDEIRSIIMDENTTNARQVPLDTQEYQQSTDEPVIRPLTQNDDINKKLLMSFLERMNNEINSESFIERSTNSIPSNNDGSKNDAEW